MEYFVYRSRALIAPESADAMEILATSILNNTRRGLTGFLHHEPELFVQYVEGPSAALWRLWDRLVEDRRHAKPTLIGRGLISHRFFSDWGMGYSNPDVASFLDFLDEASGKSRLAQASPRETIWFLRGACQRRDLGLTH